MENKMLDIEKLKLFIDIQTKSYEVMNKVDTTNYSNGALDILWALKSFIEVNNGDKG